MDLNYMYIDDDLTVRYGAGSQILWARRKIFRSGYKWKYLGFMTDFCIRRRAEEEECYTPGYFPYGPHSITACFFAYETIEECIIRALQAEQGSYFQRIKNHYKTCRLYVLKYDSNNELLYCRHVKKMW